MRQFRSKSSQIWFFEVGFTAVRVAMGKPNLAYSSLPPIFPFNALDSPKAKMRFRFMILCQSSLNGLPFIFSLPLLYKPSISFILGHTKKPPFLPPSWVLVNLSSLVISWSSWDSRYWVRVTLSLLTLLFLHPWDLYQESPPPPPYGSCMKV